MRTLKIYGTANATTTQFSYVTVPQSGRIKSIRAVITFDSITDNSGMAIELSTASAPVLGTNDVAPITEWRTYNNFVTSGMASTGQKTQEFIDYPVAAGDKLYLHAVLTGTASVICSIFVDIA